ncbi:MAG TPA: hypothetical protein PLI51_06390 [bacterium]|nr:hypothetical protein [bacterium]HPQ66338.1 hypothetical protein [bacterium]
MRRLPPVALRFPFRLCPAVLFLGLLSCAPCREVVLESAPPGAELFLPAGWVGEGGSAKEEWARLGTAPRTVPSCGLREGVLARYGETELLLPALVPGTRLVRFDFVSGEAVCLPVAPLDTAPEPRLK